MNTELGKKNYMNNLNKEDITKSVMGEKISDITNEIMEELERAQSRALIYSIIDIYFNEYTYDEYYKKYTTHNMNISKLNQPAAYYDGNITNFRYIAEYPILDEKEIDYIKAIRRSNEFGKR